MNSSLLFSLFIFCALLAVSNACIGIFPSMGGGGCGCGGGMPPPPPPSCGCGGRKKRSLPEKQSFHGIAAGDDDTVCNTPALKKIILQHMQNSATSSSKAINTELESRQLNRFVVVCSESPFVFTVRSDTSYCGATKNGHNCHAFSL